MITKQAIENKVAKFSKKVNSLEENIEKYNSDYMGIISNS